MNGSVRLGKHYWHLRDCLHNRRLCLSDAGQGNQPVPAPRHQSAGSCVADRVAAGAYQLGEPCIGRFLGCNCDLRTCACLARKARAGHERSMRKLIANLGGTPLMRRIIAAMLLVGTTIVTALLRSGGTQRWVDLSVNIVVAVIALAFLHFRWRARERKMLSPDKARDIFS